MKGNHLYELNSNDTLIAEYNARAQLASEELMDKILFI